MYNFFRKNDIKKENIATKTEKTASLQLNKAGKRFRQKKKCVTLFLIIILTLMKHLTFTAGLFAIAAMAVSCQKEQSELHLDTLPSTAVITGTVKYVVGDYQLEDESVVSGYTLPAAGQTVMVTIPTSDYASNADGNQYFEAVTDDNGQYRIEIPISMNSLNATLSVLPFYAKKDFAQDDLSMVSIENALYNKVAVGDNTTDLTVSLEQKKIYTANLVVSSDAKLPVAFDQPVEIKGLATV